METWQNGILTPQQTPVENKLFGNYQSKFTLKVYFTMFKDWYAEQSKAKMESWKIHPIFAD